MRFHALMLFFILLLSCRFSEAETPNDTVAPPPAGLIFQHAYQFFQKDAYTEAIQSFQAFRDADPTSLLGDYALLYLGVSYLKTAQYVRAQDTFAQLQNYPQSLLNDDAAFFIADTYYYRQDYPTAIQHYLALKKGKRFSKHALFPDMLLKLADCCEKTGQFAQAFALYRQTRLTFITTPIYETAKMRETGLIAQYPSLKKLLTTAMRLKEADALLDAGRAADAVAILLELAQTEQSPSLREKILLNLADGYYRLRENQTALDYYQKIIRDYPTSKLLPAVFERIGRLYLRQGDFAAFQRIDAYLRSTYPHDPATAGVVYLKGKEFQQRGDAAEAENIFTQFLASYPKSPLIADVLWRIGWLKYQRRQDDAALQVFERFLQKYPKSLRRDEVLYWAGKTAERLGNLSKTAAFYANNAKVSRNSYYGFLSVQALSQLQHTYPNAKLPSISITIKPLEMLPAVYATEAGKLHHQKAQALAALELYAQAVTELSYAVEREKRDALKYLELAQLYDRAGNAHELVRLMRKHFWEQIIRGDERLPQSFWKLVYPATFSPMITQSASSKTLDPLFVLAIMFAESEFDPKAYSPAGARGLMQLMPATGERIAAQLGVSKLTPEMYFQPDVNIVLGAAYLNQLLALFDQQIAPVTASYNAGETAVTTWWREPYRENIPEFIASIPYEETKKYVQRVLWYYREYQRMYPNLK